MKQVLMTMHNLSTSAGGITRVMMNRGRMFREVGIEASIATFAWNPGLGVTVKQLKQQGRLTAAVPVLNLYTYYSALSDAKNPVCVASKAGLCVESAGAHVDQGSVRVVTDATSGLKLAEEHLSPDGHRYLTKHYAVNGLDLSGVTLFKADGTQAASFSSLNNLYTHWLSELAQSATPCAIIADAPWSAVPVLNVRAPHTFRILTIHNNHYVAPFRYGADLRDSYAGILRTFTQADALAVLTEAQRQDIEQQFGKSEKIHCIPNSVTVFEPGSPIERDPTLVVAIARYHKTKGLTRIIKAFKRVVRRVPHARLALYGAGEQEHELRQLITRLRLNRVVTLNGYAVQVADVLRRAGMVVAASRFEGFGLGVAEALSEGTPVVSLDCNYGPAEIITDGVDGHLAYTDLDLSDLIIELLRNPTIARRMGEAGRDNMRRFSKEAIRERWLALFAQLQAQGTEPCREQT